MTAPAPAPTASRLPGARAVLLFGLAYMLVWTLLPPQLASSFPLDVVESLSWGREWQWGNYKHPPLAPWLLHVSYRVFGDFGPYLLSQLFIAATAWFVWLTGRRLMSPERALLGAALMLSVAHYTRPALEFNHNIAQMPVWAALAWLFLAALQDGRLRLWLALGLVAGLGLLTKYTVSIMLACLGLYLLLTPARRQLRGIGPWAALAVALLVLAPHLLWLWQMDWLPFSYAGGRGATEAAGDNARASALRFMRSQALNHLPLALMLLAALPGSPRKPGTAGSATRWQLQARPAAYLLTIALGPGLLLSAVGLVLGLRLRDMWGSPMWAFSGLLVAAVLPAARLPVLRSRLLIGMALWLLTATLLSGAYLGWGAQWRQRPARTDWPGPTLALAAQHSWASQSRCALDVVAGDYWLSGLVAVYAADQPSVLIPGDARFSPWATPERLRQHGALWIWEGPAPAAPPAPLDAVAEHTDFRLSEGRWSLPWPYDSGAEPLVLHWRAYVPPGCSSGP